MAVIALPFASVTPVVMVTEYAVKPACVLVVNTAWFPAHVESVQPGLVDVIFKVLTVAQFTFSDHVIVTLLFTATPVAPFAGIVELTAGAVLSIVTVFPAPSVSTLFDESVARLFKL